LSQSKNSVVKQNKKTTIGKYLI